MLYFYQTYSPKMSLFCPAKEGKAEQDGGSTVPMKKIVLSNVYQYFFSIFHGRSVKRALNRLSTVAVCVSLFCLLLYGGYSIWTYEEQLLFCNQAALDIYTNELRYELNSLSTFNQEIYSDDSDFQLLAGNNLSDQQRLISEYNLMRIVKSRTPSFGAILVFNATGQVHFYHFGSAMTGFALTPAHLQLTRDLRDFWVDTAPSSLMKWRVYNDGTHVLLTNAYCLNGLYICSVLDLDAFFLNSSHAQDALQYVVYTDGQILTNQDYLDSHHLTLDDLLHPRQDFFSTLSSRQLVQSVYLPEYGIGIGVIQSLHGIWSYSRVSVLFLILLFFAMLTTLCVVGRLIRRTLVYPLEQITLASRNLEQGLPAREEVPGTEPEEFAQIRVALNRLVEQRVHLEQDNRDKEYDRNHALLQYYQMQTRSHFFLNCLTSLYNMLEQKSYEKMSIMILAFSKHLRYIFHDNLTLVTLQAELDEVSDYHKIILLNREFPLLLSVEVPPDLTDCLVPPLIIQTFLENSCKYNGKNNSILNFSIRVDQVSLEGAPYLRLRLSDNGVGYSDEILSMLNEQNTDYFQHRRIGISNLKWRISLIYRENVHLAFYNAPGGGACSLLCIPLRRSSPDEKEGE